MKTLEDKVDSLNAWNEQMAAYQNVEFHTPHSDIKESKENVTKIRTAENDVLSLVDTISEIRIFQATDIKASDNILDQLFEVNLDLQLWQTSKHYKQTTCRA